MPKNHGNTSSPALLAFEEQKRLLRKKEPLHPDLSRYLVPAPFGGLEIHHPLLFSGSFSYGRFALVNRQYEAAKRAVDDARKRKDWYTFVFLHELPYQLRAFQKIARRLTDGEYWHILGRVYTQSENLFQESRLLTKLLTSMRPEREQIMSVGERRYFMQLPRQLTIYRGYRFDNAEGWSWTLSYKKAKWFALRFKASGMGTPRIATGKVQKKLVIAYFARRKEQEIVVNPQDVKIVRQEEL